jgi:predicted ferric reductase
VSEETLWFAARASGIVAWALLTLAVVWGLLLSSRAAGERVRTPWLLDLHRFLGVVALVLIAIHLAAILANDFVPFDVADLFVPFLTTWRPGAVAWGIAALYVVLAVEITSRLRKRLSTRAWHRVHVLSLPAWVAASIHLLRAGTDAHDRVLLAVLFASLAVVLALLVLRLLGHRTLLRIERRAARGAPGRRG